ncbi:aromatic-ring hydroxylase C-terminal domain-containing protein [Nonomuraea phyllanthi]|nr:hypothetical protein [Nonomuraea phyllanthi]
MPVHVIEGRPYGTLLVRPDGFVAWRGEEGLAEALGAYAGTARTPS